MTELILSLFYRSECFILGIHHEVVFLLTPSCFFVRTSDIVNFSWHRFHDPEARVLRRTVTHVLPSTEAPVPPRAVTPVLSLSMGTCMLCRAAGV